MTRPPQDCKHRSDGELVAAVNAGEMEAFEALYRRHRDWVVRLAWRLTGDREAALDILQETFAWFLQRFPGFELRAKMTTYMYPIVRNLAITQSRKQRRHAEVTQRLAAGQSDASDTTDYWAEESSDQLNRFLTRLPEQQRETLILRFVDGLSLQQIAEATGVPAGTVKSRLHHAIGALRDDPASGGYFRS